MWMTGILLLTYYACVRFFFQFAFVRNTRIRFLQKEKKVQTLTGENQRRKSYITYADQGKKWFESMPYQDIYLSSYDELGLHGYYLKNKNAKRSVLCSHGYRSTGLFDFGAIARFYYEHDSNVLIIDQRSHGKSEGEYITFGVKERFDIVTWAEWIDQKNDKKLPIYMNGLSMGTSAVLMSLDQELPNNIKGIIADCGFTSPADIIKSVAENLFSISVQPIIYGLNKMCLQKADFSIYEVSTLDVLKHNDIPVLFIHGDDDNFVPQKMTIENYNACSSPKKLIKVKGAMHAMSYMTDEENYSKELLQFFQQFD